MTDFVDLHVHSTHSILDGHPDPGQIVNKAVELGRSAIALTDHGSIGGHVLFEKAIQGKADVVIGSSTLHVRDGKQLGIKPIYGMEAYAVASAKENTQGKFHLSLLAKNQTGYKNLNRLVTRSWSEGYYYRQSIDGAMLLDHHEGLIVLSGCETGAFMRAIERADYNKAVSIASNFKSAFGDDFYIELQHFPHTSQKAAVAWAIANHLKVKAVLTCDAHYLDPDGWRYQQFLWSIRDGKPVDDFKIEYAYLWEPERLLAFCKEHHPGILWEGIFENTLEVADKVERYELPKAPNVVFPFQGDKLEYVRNTCHAFLQERGLYNDEYLGRLAHELDVIMAKGYLDYFLVVADMISWAKSQGIFVGPARGSAAGSLVCYCLRITEVDPIRFKLLFERFVDPTRTDLPDIDNDFEDERRAEVFAYMERKYGSQNTAFISTFSRLQGKSALDDAAKSYHIPRNDIDIIKRHLVERSSGDQRAELTISDTIDEFPEAKEVWERYPALSIVAGVEGKIRHMGRHAAGLVVTSEPISEYTALIGKPGEDKLISVDWRDSQHLNLMKIDCLGLKEMTLLRLICGRIGWTVEDLYKLPLDDAETFAGFNRADYLGIFQFTGLATKGIASRVEFKTIEQVGDVNALSRPGPLHAGATELYLQGHKSGTFRPILPQPAVQPIIAPTYGQIIYQEQVMRILRDIGSMSWQDVCDIRSIMGKSKGSEAMDKYWPKWVKGCADNGYGETDARQIWDTIRQYGKHSFNLAHALSYGILAYWSMYMKVHHPREFYWAQLVKAVDDNVAARFIAEAKRKGLAFRPFGLDAPTTSWWIDSEGAIAPGWGCLRGVGPKCGEELAPKAPFADMDDLRERVNRRIINKNVQAAIEDNIGSSVDILYGLDRWVLLDAAVGEHDTISNVNQGQIWGEKAFIAGRLNRINKKNRIEEKRTRGEDYQALIDSGKPMDYVILIVEDPTDSMMVYVSPEKYLTISDELWKRAKEETYVAAWGNKLKGIQLLSAKELRFVDILDKPVFKSVQHMPNDRNGTLS